MKLGGAQDRPWQPGTFDELLDPEFGTVIAVLTERLSIDAHDGDIYQVRDLGQSGCRDQVSGRLHVTLQSAGAVDHHGYASQGRFEAYVRSQVAGGPANRFVIDGRPVVAAEDPHIVVDREQAGNDLAAKGARATGHQDGSHHELRSVLRTEVASSCHLLRTDTCLRM